jgi:hypothetical protein
MFVAIESDMPFEVIPEVVQLSSGFGVELIDNPLKDTR